MNYAFEPSADRKNANKIGFDSCLVADNQLCPNEVYITASTKQKGEVISLDIKAWGR